MITSQKFQSSLVNLEDIAPLHFVVPSYQRPYVWGDFEIKKLISDFYRSFLLDSSKNYYVGTILTKENGIEAELIDGQQRFTTLWLVAFVFFLKNSGSDIERLLKSNSSALKMSFEIRVEVTQYFEHLMKTSVHNFDSEIKSSDIVKHPYLKNIAMALTTIHGLVEEEIDSSRLMEFGNFIYTKVHFIKNTTPDKIDLNKLFSTINSAGIQLEQTDIVKSNLLKHIEDKVLYGKVWEACENMGNFFERNVRSSFPRTDWSRVNLSDYHRFDRQVFLYDKTKEINTLDDRDFFSIDRVDLSTIPEYKVDVKEEVNEKRESEEIYCRSIINFGQLLLHAYRIHLKLEDKPDFEGTFHVNRLIEIFAELNNPDEIKRFIERLWAIRQLFDKYIVKWISDSDSKIEHLELVNINKNSDHYYSRTPYERSSMLMLQSVMYFTGDYLRQFWLTTYLNHLLLNHENCVANDDQLLRILEDIDNQLSLCTSLTDKEATFKLLSEKIKWDFDFTKYLTKNHFGTGFKHYWFQKLEYVLWKNWPVNIRKEEHKSYRITSRNSVEHIYPQNPGNRTEHPIIDDQYLHSFGNLVLLNVSQNSEYGNKSVSVKRSMFKEKRATFDTLKSYHIFNYENWTSEEIEHHKNLMITELKTHYRI